MDPELQMILVVTVLAGTFLCFAKEWIPAELAALAGFAALLGAGILDEKDLAGIFGNAAPATIGAMFILSEALTRTGIIDYLALRFQSLAKGSEIRALTLLAIIVIPASAFLNNTPVVVVFLPIIIATCRGTGLKATRLLLPLSFLSILGGTTTLIGTSTNLLVAGVAADVGQPAFSIFEITKLGVIYAALGSLYMVLIGRHLLPAEDTVSSTLDLKDTRRFYSAIEISGDSPFVGQRLVESPLLAGDQKFSIYQVVRQGRNLTIPINQITVRADDIYWVRASPSDIARIKAMPGVRLLRRHPLPGEGETAESGENQPKRTEAGADLKAGEVRIVEAIIGPESGLIGKTIRRAALRQRYGILVAALHRRGRNLREDFENIPLSFGDTLILEGPTAEILRFHEEDDVLSLQELKVTVRQTRRAPIAIAALGGVVLCSAVGILPITSAAIIGGVIVVLSGCLSIKTAFAAIDWKILFLIYGMLGIGRAMEKTGVARLAAESLTGLLEPAGPVIILAGVYLLSSILTEVVTNNAVAIILTPIVIGIAGALGIDPRPLIVAVMFGASASFITPIGYQTNTYVYGAGNYRFKDFARVGIPLNLGLAIIATWLIPRFWPF